METTESLNTRWENTVFHSWQAICRHPGIYREIRWILCRVICDTIDIDAYYPIAERLAGLLEQMGPNTIFHHYFLENVDPDKNCRARYFRHICLDLLNQMDYLCACHQDRHRLERIK